MKKQRKLTHQIQRRIFKDSKNNKKSTDKDRRNFEKQNLRASKLGPFLTMTTRDNYNKPASAGSSSPKRPPPINLEDNVSTPSTRTMLTPR